MELSEWEFKKITMTKKLMALMDKVALKVRWQCKQRNENCMKKEEITEIKNTNRNECL